jgi:kynureninase
VPPHSGASGSTEPRVGVGSRIATGNKKPKTNMSQDQLLRFRQEFSILQKTTYLISNSLGAMPKGTRNNLNHYVDEWETRGVRAWAESWWDLPVAVANELAPIIGAARGSVSMHQNVTIASQVALSCFDFNAPKNKIVLIDMEFPSLVYLYQEQTRRGARIEMVNTEDGVGIDTQRLLDAIDEDTLLVPISHVLFRSSFIMDAKAIIEKAHSVGAYVILDCFQSAGVVPFNITELNADFAVGGCLKWLCGGPGNCYLYVRPDLSKKLRPSFTGWMADAHPFDFRVGSIERREDAYRFLNGTPAIASLYAAREGLRIINEAGPQSIREKSQRQTALLIAEAARRGYRVTAPKSAAQRAGTVAIDCPEAFAVSRALLARDIIVDYRPQAGIRISPHFYTADAECLSAIQAIEDILADGEWRSFAAESRRVT